MAALRRRRSRFASTNSLATSAVCADSLSRESYAGHLAGQIASHVLSLDVLVQPCAAEIYRANVAFGADEDDAVAAAVEDVERRDTTIRQLLGVRRAA